jgi:hypothetical protein
MGAEGLESTLRPESCRVRRSRDLF